MPRTVIDDVSLSVCSVSEAIKRLNYTDLYGQQISVMVADREHMRRRRCEGNIFVKGLDPEIDSQTLHDTFDIFGPVLSAKVSRTADGVSLGYGYVQFLHSASAEEAIKKANKMMLKQRTITVEKFKPRHERQSAQYTNVFVKHLPHSVQNEEQLTTLFKPYGAITSVYLPMVRQSRRTYAPREISRRMAKLRGLPL